MFSNTHAQLFTENLIHGKVVDRNGNPIPFASIHLKNALYGTYTDSVGNFGVQFVKDDSLIVGSLGFKSKCIYPSFRESNTIQLQEKDVTIPEVQILGTDSYRRSTQKYGVVFDKPDFRAIQKCGDAVVTEVLIDARSTLKNVNLDFAFAKNSTAPVTVIRPIVYASDENGKPGLLLFASKQLYKIRNTAKKLTINLEKERVLLEGNKIFIGVEFLWNETNKGVKFVGHQKVATLSSASLKCNPNLGVRKTWRRYRGGNWTNNYWSFMNYTINAVVYGEIISY